MLRNSKIMMKLGLAAPVLARSSGVLSRQDAIASHRCISIKQIFTSRSVSMSSKTKQPINLLRGWPAPSLLPVTQLASAAQVVLSGDPSITTPSLQYGPDEGYAPLRTAVSKWLSQFYSCPDEEARICITGGASQNLACALQVFTDVQSTKAVWMVAPCYFLACRIFEDAGFAGRLRAVKEAEGGIDLDYLEVELEQMEGSGERKPAYKPSRPWSKFYTHIIYAVPTFSNPSGQTMTLAQRRRLVDIARKYDALVITDDVYDFLQWPTSSPCPTGSTTTALLPRLSDIDRELPALPTDPNHFGHTLSNASFSKIAGPGVRTGWTDSMPALSYALSQCGSSRSGGCPSQLGASIMAQLLQSGELQKHIHETLCPEYQKRWKLIVQTAERELIPLGVEMSRESLEGKDVAGGYFIWLRLPEGISAERVAMLAWDMEQLVLGKGSIFEVYGDEDAARMERELRVCLAWVDHTDLVEGIERLATVIAHVQSGKDLNTAEEGGSHGIKKSLGEFK